MRSSPDLQLLLLLLILYIQLFPLIFYSVANAASLATAAMPTVIAISAIHLSSTDAPTSRTAPAIFSSNRA